MTVKDSGTSDGIISLVNVMHCEPPLVKLKG
jgi:hypothetical protein